MSRKKPQPKPKLPSTEFALKYEWWSAIKIGASQDGFEEIELELKKRLSKHKPGDVVTIPITPKTSASISKICANHNIAVGHGFTVAASPYYRGENRKKPPTKAVLDEALKNAAEELETIKKGEFQND